MNSQCTYNTFASPDTQADASACEGAVFLPMHQRLLVHLLLYENDF